MGHFGPKCQIEGGIPPPTICARTDRPANALTLPLTVFTQRNFVADFHGEKSIFYTENEKIVAFKAPFGGLGATYAVHRRFVGKLVGDFLLVIELFSLGAFVLSQYTRLTDRRTDGQMLTTIPRLHSCSAVKT